MKFKFNINTSEQDYVEYNRFVFFQSHYGKKDRLTFRVAITVILGIYILLSLIGGNFTLDSFIDVLPSIILLILIQVFISPICILFLRFYIKSLKKRGKSVYSPSSILEFYDDIFIEITPENKNECKYLAIDRISVVKDKVIYIHINSLSAGILPFSCFESKEQYNEFFDFIKTKCSNIDIY